MTKFKTHHSVHTPKLMQKLHQLGHKCNFQNPVMQLLLASIDYSYHFQFFRFLNWYPHELNRNQPQMNRETWNNLECEYLMEIKSLCLQTFLYTYHDTDEAWTFTAQESDIVLPLFTCTSCDPIILALAAEEINERIN